jgi:NAD-dependent dihydropyrimidine dehydrogenase PreA subunit
MVSLYATNTLQYNRELCNNCGMCCIVCPHAVFASGEDAAELVNPEACMECGACQKNCPTGAITVDSGVGCAAAMIMAALTGQKEACCGPRDPSDSGQADSPELQATVCCGPGEQPVSKQKMPQTTACCGSSRQDVSELQRPENVDAKGTKEKLQP